MLATNVWQISRQNLRFLTVLGEGNFGKVKLEFQKDFESIVEFPMPILFDFFVDTL